MDAVGQLTGGIAHDFNNILSIIIGNLNLLERQSLDAEEVVKRTEVAKKAAYRAADLTKQLLGFSRRQPAQITLTNINSVIKDMNSLIARAITPEVTVDEQLAEDLWITKIDSGDLQDALLNLIINARDAMRNGGHLVIETCNCTLDVIYCSSHQGVVPGDYTQLTISDTGEGIPAKQIENIFEPFFTTKPQGKGTGLGVAMVFGFIKRSRGHINVYSEQGIGTTFRLYLPRAEGEVEADGYAQRELEGLQRGNETILAVDDEEGLLDLAQESLQALGYRVLTAENGTQALEVLNETSSISLLFSDVVMPGGMSGYELAELATTKRPNLKVLLTSGYTERSIATNSHHQYKAKLLCKPYTPTELAKLIREILDDKSRLDS